MLLTVGGGVPGRWRALVPAAALLAVAGCGGSSAGPGGAAPAPVVSPSASPSPSREPAVAPPACPLPIGATVTLGNPSAARLRLTVSRPTWSRTSLSRDYGKTPRNGFYLSVQARVTSVGGQSALVSGEDFYVLLADGKKVTTNDGNGPYSGASQAFATTALDPGETVTGPLTFDVAKQRGQVVFAPASAPACSWRF